MSTFLAIIIDLFCVVYFLNQLLLLQLPRQLAVHLPSGVVINCFSSGESPERKSMIPESAHFKYTVGDLVPWKTYNFEVIFFIELGGRKLFGPSLASALVIGKGKSTIANSVLAIVNRLLLTLY